MWTCAGLSLDSGTRDGLGRAKTFVKGDSAPQLALVHGRIEILGGFGHSSGLLVYEVGGTRGTAPYERKEKGIGVDSVVCVLCVDVRLREDALLKGRMGFNLDAVHHAHIDCLILDM
jgi:hypothetical protein